MKFLHKWLLRRRINHTIRLLKKVDTTMKALKMPKWQRKQMWRDFIKSEQNRMGMIDLLNGGKP